MTTKQTSTSLNDFDATLDAIAAAARQAISELETRIKEARIAADHPRHARLHRLHRAAHDFVLVAAEARAGRAA
jgi:hypothetical protein